VLLLLIVDLNELISSGEKVRTEFMNAILVEDGIGHTAVECCADIDALLIDAARLNARIRQTYNAVKYDPTARYYCYVLLLNHGKIYIGSTDNIYERMLAHHTMTSTASTFVKLHGPPLRILEISKNARADHETYKTLTYMDLYGYENVRGGAYCRTELKSPPVALDTFVRDRDKEFDYMTRQEIETVVRIVADLARSEGCDDG
jgi:hypothetical protein